MSNDTWTFHVTFRGEEAVDEVKNLYADCGDLSNLKQGPLMCVIFRLGLLAFIDNHTDGLNNRVQLARMEATLRGKYDMFRRMESMLESLSREQFDEWCEKYEVDTEEFWLWRENQIVESDSQSGRMRRWLFEQFPSADTEIATKDIRARAEKDGIINENNDEDWQALRRVANRAGYTGGRYGFWKRTTSF